MADLTVEQTERLAALEVRTDLTDNERGERDGLLSIRDEWRPAISDFTDTELLAGRPVGLRDDEAARPAVEPTPRERYAALDAKKPHPSAVIVEDVRTEYEENQHRILGERFAAADRLAALRAQSTRTAEEDSEMAQLQATVLPEDIPVA